MHNSFRRMWSGHYIRSFPLVYTMAASVVAFSFHVYEPRKSNYLLHGMPADFSFQSIGYLASHLSFRHVTRCEAVRDPSIEQDYELMRIDRGVFADRHAIFGVLMGKDMIEKYDVYKRPVESSAANVVVAHVKLGGNVDGHPGMVHGGILALILDDFLGFGFKALGVEMAVTANLNVDFRAPVFAGSEVRIQAQLARLEGRKLFWTVQMTSLDGKALYAECTSLYIIPRTTAK